MKKPNEFMISSHQGFYSKFTLKHESGEDNVLDLGNFEFNNLHGHKIKLNFIKRGIQSNL